MNPRFSVIVPLYNKADYVRHSLESIAAQTFRDYEVIIVNDGSTDNSLAVVKEFIERIDDRCIDDRWTILSQTNAGVAAARNNGVAKSRGEYVCFLDADDWWEPNFFEGMEQLIREYPDAGLYATNYVYYKPGKTRVALNFERGYMNYPEAYLHSTMMPVCTISVCMPRKVFDEMGGFPLGIRLGEDFLLWAKTTIKYKVAFCEKPLAYYNNDVPAHLRATRNLHKPQCHMLFNMDDIEQSAISSPYSDTWKALLDKLRVNGLMAYWLSDEYHDMAAEELKKVDWSKLPKKIKSQYMKPRWWLKMQIRILQMGSSIKQSLINSVKL